VRVPTPLNCSEWPGFTQLLLP